jgi:multidrug efflux system membrane fusion protein
MKDCDVKEPVISSRRAWSRWACCGVCPAAVAVMLSFALTACSIQKSAAVTGPPGGGLQGPVPVHAADVTSQTMPVQLTNFGTVEPYATISVKAQVSGELTKVWFKEGDVVKEGDTLFTIDPRPYEVALKQAEANLAKAQAELKLSQASLVRSRAQAGNAKVELDRNSQLKAKGMVSPETLDTSRTNAEALEAGAKADEAGVQSAAEAVRVAQATIEGAKLQLDYCTVRAPITGKTGHLQINRGNLVMVIDTNPLVTINQIEPVYVSFTAPDTELEEIREYAAKGPLEVKAVIPHYENEPAVGTLTFIDNAVDPDTRTIRLKGTFKNDDNRLWPGQYIPTVILQLATRANVTVAPSQAVQRGQDGAYAYVVTADMKAELRKVTPGDTVSGLTEIRDGLQPGEKVVTDGHLRLTPGAPVTISEQAAEGKAAA